MAIASGVGVSVNALGTFAGFARQNQDEDAVRSIVEGAREVVRTASTQADRFEKDLAQWRAEWLAAINSAS